MSGGIVLKRIFQLLCSVALIAVLMSGSLTTTAKETESTPSNQVLASVGTSSVNREVTVNRDTEMAALASVMAGLGLILVGCFGLFVLDRS